MQFTTTTKSYAVKDSNGNKTERKAIIAVTLDVASHPEGKGRKEEAEKLEARASHVMAEIAGALSLEYEGLRGLLQALSEASGIGLMTATQEEAYGASLAMLAKAASLREVKLNGSALSLALQGVGPNAKFITNALRKAVRGFLLLDNID